MAETKSSFDATLEEIKSFVKEELFPLEPIFLQKGFYAVEEQLRAKRAMVKERGWWAPPIPREYGGMGLSLPDFARLSEVLGLSLLGHLTFNCQAPDIGNMELLLEVAND